MKTAISIPDNVFDGAERNSLRDFFFRLASEVRWADLPAHGTCRQAPRSKLQLVLAGIEGIDVLLGR